MKFLNNMLIAAAGNSVTAANNAWNLNSAIWDFAQTYTGPFSATNAAYTSGLSLKPDGTSIFVYNYDNDKLYEYELRVPYKLGSMRGDVPKNNTAVSLASLDLRYAATMSNDGTKFYAAPISEELRTHVLTEAWNIATLQTADSANSGYFQGTPRDISFANNGYTLYVGTGAIDQVLSYTLTESWNVATAVFDGAENYPRNLALITMDGFCFNADGSKAYIALDTTTNYVREYKLSVPYCISSAVQIAQTAFPSGSDATPVSLFLKPDGTKLYMLGQGTDQVTQLSLTTANDSTTMSFDKNLSITGQEATPRALYFKDDGTKMYVVGITGDDVNEYGLSTAWDVGSASFTRTKLISAQTTAPQGIAFNNDGTKMFITSDAGTAGANHLLEYSLSEGWNVASASYTSSVDVSSMNGVLTGVGIAPAEVRFNSDGTKCFVGQYGGSTIFEFDLSTGFDISTISARSLTLPQKGILNHVDSFGITASNNGTYLVVSTGSVLTTYQMSESYNVATATSIGTSTELSTAADFLTSSPDGTYIYGLEQTTTSPDWRYMPLSSAWNVATGVANTITGFSVTTQETAPQSVTFKSDGTKMYIIGTTGDDVNEYDLSTAWDISTATYNQVFYVGTQETAPQSVTFSANGKYMYVAGTSGDDVNQYTLGTEWDISTAVYTRLFAPGKSNLYALEFKPDGTEMYIGSSTGDMNQYTLGTAWNISTATFTGVLETGTFAYGITIDPTGTIMFINNSTYGYSRWDLSTAWDLSSATLTTARTEEDLAAIALGSIFQYGMYVKSDGTKFYAVSSDDVVSSFSMV